MKKEFNVSNLICYGYGEAFAVINQLLDLDIQYIVDRDISKWGKTPEGYEVVGWEILKLLDISQYNILILPFQSNQIEGLIKETYIKENQIYLLKDVLEANEELKEQYDRLYSERIKKKDVFKQKFRQVRANQLGNLRKELFEDEFKKWFVKVPKFTYREIVLNELLASDISILLDFVHNPDAEMDLYWHPTDETYHLYGEGNISVPIFVRNRPDFYQRIEKMTSDIKGNIQYISYHDVPLDFTSEMNVKSYHFHYELKEHHEVFSKNIIEAFEQVYFKLSPYEYQWLDYSIRFYICLIDFYKDILNIHLEIKLMLLPNYGEENLVNQMNRSNSLSIVYQHGDYPALDRPINKFHRFLLKYAFHVHRFMVWDEESKSRLIQLNPFATKDNVIVLGDISEMKYENTIKRKHFIVCLPGKILNDEEAIEELIGISVEVAECLGLTFDLRYHPLNKKQKRIDTKIFIAEVSIEDFDINNYDFALGYSTTLIKELYNAGLPSYSLYTKQNYSTGTFQNKEELCLLIQQLYEGLPAKIADGKPQESISDRYTKYLRSLFEGEK